jgi:hypothetical protein
MLAYTKIGAIVALALALFFAGWKVEAWRCRAAAEALSAAQASAVAKAVLAQKIAADAESARLNGIIETYEQAALTPIPVADVDRLYVAACAATGPLPKTGAPPAGTVAAGTVASPARPTQADVSQSLTDYINACTRDGERLNALIQAWPQR